MSYEKLSNQFLPQNRAEFALLSNSVNLDIVSRSSFEYVILFEKSVWDKRCSPSTILLRRFNQITKKVWMLRIWLVYFLYLEQIFRFVKV